MNLESKVTPVSVKISVKLVDLFFLINAKGPPLGDLGKNKQKLQISRFVDFLQIGQSKLHFKKSVRKLFSSATT